MKRGNFLAALAAAFAATQIKITPKAIATPAGVNLGAESSVTIITSQGTVIGLNDRLQSIELRARTSIREDWDAYDASAPPDRRVLFDGWDGSLELDRRNATLDEFFTSEEAAYYQQPGYAEPTYCTIVHTIRDVNGEISIYQYPNTVLMPQRIEYKRGESASYRIAFRSPERYFIGTAFEDETVPA